MNNALISVLPRENVIRTKLLNSSKVLFKLNSVKRNSECLKSFSAGNISYREHRWDQYASQKRHLPNLFYLQNPITWLINKIDFLMLEKAWDEDFSEKEFKRGVRQAVAVICTLVSSDLWNNLRGLLTNKTLARLQRDVEINWTQEQRKIIALEPSDIKLILPRKVNFLKIAEQKFVDVDVICVAMKFLEEPSGPGDFALIEILTRFHRNYSFGQLPNWTITLFKKLVDGKEVSGFLKRKIQFLFLIFKIIFLFFQFNNQNFKAL